jgi:alkylation response protein AidB-like acyl-CoA dehydrogenase
MLSPSATRAYLNQEPPFNDIACSLRAVSRQPKAMNRETRMIVAFARRFKQQVVKPRALELDRYIYQHPGYLPKDFLRECCRWRLFSLWIPRIFGGQGYSPLSCSYFLEEVASGCLGISNLIGVHYLGMTSLIAPWNTRVIQKILREVVTEEKKGRACIISLGLTESEAGTDMEDTALMDRGQVRCTVKPVRNGYLVNGRKVFISNGHLSRWHVVFAFSDPRRPSETLTVLAVRSGSRGLRLGRKENKMGQRACPAGELIFEDCFVPRANVCIDPYQMRRLKRPPAETTMQIIDYVFSVSRAGVAAFAAGAARGAYELALGHAADTRVGGNNLINHQWAQTVLAEMYKNQALARLAYTEANYAVSLDGMYRRLQFKHLSYLLRWMPDWALDKLSSSLLDTPTGTRLLRRLHLDHQTDAEIQRTTGWGSLAKLAGTDAALKNCRLAMELTGQQGLRHESGVEKFLRDAKLLQIYAGTNQLNRLNLFKALIARQFPRAAVF